MPEGVVISLTEQLACARRELAMRINVYPRWVANEKMTAKKSAHEIAAMQAIVETLEGLARAERLL